MADKTLAELKTELQNDGYVVGTEELIEGTTGTKITGLEIWQIPVLDVDSGTAKPVGFKKGIPVYIRYKNNVDGTEVAWLYDEVLKGPRIGAVTETNMAPYRTHLETQVTAISHILNENFDEKYLVYSATCKVLDNSLYPDKKYKVWKEDGSTFRYSEEV